jgi:hypothetical protein
MHFDGKRAAARSTDMFTPTCAACACRNFCVPGLFSSGIVRDRKIFMLGTILVIILVLILLGALPTWPYSSGWGYYPSGGLGLVLVIVLILVLLGRL